ncbi:MAG TPA: histidine kinase [Candidatus Dormibacteraeota bacterium]|nr:histidine kinase [Candidatus Dormibacteraeota bacterium]
MSPDRPPDAELAASREEVAHLRRELEETNRGLIALYAELETAREAEAAARASREVLAARDRIARDINQGAIQAIFAVGMRLQATATMSGDEAVRERLEGLVRELDAVITDLRRHVFGIQAGEEADDPQA